MKLYRAMALDGATGLPVVGRSARRLGIRPPLEAGVRRADVKATAPGEIIQPGTGGMSCTPNDPLDLPEFRRPPELGGDGKDPVWEIDTNDSDRTARLTGSQNRPVR